MPGMSFIHYLCDMKVREVITYKNYFEDFFAEQERKVQDKIIKVLDIIEQIDRIPSTYLKYIEGTNGLFEVRIKLGTNIFRIFCFFDGNKFVILLSGLSYLHTSNIVQT